MTDEIVALHVRYYHRAPVTAKTRLLGDDLIACILGGVYTDVEKTMIEVRRGDVVRDTRNHFQHAIQDKLIEIVERLCGRSVLSYVSHSHVGPDLAVELFMLEPHPVTP